MIEIYGGIKEKPIKIQNSNGLGLPKEGMEGQKRRKFGTFDYRV
jgi:hypothetical protein